MTAVQRAYGLRTSVALPYAAAVERTRAALGARGFGILTEIDVAATMKQKLGVDYRPYVILGACNPPLAHRALEAEPEIGLLLPCNVIVYQEGEACVVEAIDPEAALGVAPRNAALTEVASEAKARLQQVIESVGDTERGT